MRKKLFWIFMFSACYVVQLCAQSFYTVSHYDEFSGMAQWWVTQIVQDRQGMIWFSTWNGLNRYDGYQFESFKSRVGDDVDIPTDRIMDMVLDNDGNLLCYIEGGVFVFDVKTCKYREISKSLETKALALFKQRHNKELADEGKPIVVTDRYGKAWRIPGDIDIDPNVKYCMTDSEGNVWLRSMFGAYRLSFRKHRYTTFPQERPDQVRSFYVDGKQRYWVTGRDDKTVRLFDKDNRLLGYLGRDGRLHAGFTSFGASVYHVMQDSRGAFWLCSKPDGLFRVREQEGMVFSVEHFRHDAGDRSSLSNDELYFAKEDCHHRLWIATFNDGLNCLVDPGAEKPVFLHRSNGLTYPKDKGLRSRQIFITNDNVMLAATTSGLLVADVSKKDTREIRFRCHVKDIHRANSLSNNATMYVTEDSKHRLYVCTESGGLNQITSDDLLADKLEFRHYNISTGLPADVALSAVPMSDSLLIVSNNQLILLNPDDESPMNNTAFFLKDRLRFSDALPTQLPDGRWIFGLQNGAFTIEPQDLKKSSYVPSLTLTGISVENGIVDHAVCWKDTLVLQPSRRNFTVYFAALNFSGNENISYAFKMGGDDSQWNNIGKNHSATFLDLRPGEYKLKIRSTNNDGIWVDNVRTLTVVVKPTFWETRWAKVLYALLIVMTAWGIILTRRYIVSLKHHQQKLHEAYLTLLNSREQSAGYLPETADLKPEKAAKPNIKQEDEAFMQRAMKFIEEHIDDSDINIGDMAEATLTSRSGLNRKMKSLLGVTPLDFIREARIRRACLLLKEGMSVNDVAYGCGFSDPKYFGKCFKAEMGMTPTEYRNQA